MSTRILLTVALLAGGACASVQAADFPVNRSVTDAQLDRIRGGFDFGDNLKASFALQRTVLINGMEAMRTTISVPDIASMTADQATALQNAMRTTFIANGMVSGPTVTTPPTANEAAVASAANGVVGNAATATAPVGAAAATAPVVTSIPSAGLPGLVVQNALDNQVITATTTIDASVNTATMLQNLRVSESIRDAVIQFRGN
ncbi:hypothetical protein SAMN02800694_2049 [Luteibacter sp. UNCMF331Sha3.1]|uniref:hypothetical protein n=1 Tax=Luteibacter sp. UNCMF331Sha3.1 TaxID=1502760 RepID=UPI0008D0458D|nr:hypothetical protein [Luteibacter sp. UNCMF331Sha3.1]SEM89306.1 hypothetical protein SAMN02800694_2049 [Luteibacter sp. UNCMF331Sha3.1]